MQSSEMTELYQKPADDVDRHRLIEQRFLDFALQRTVGSNQSEAMQAGRFAATPGRDKAELFGSVDMVYAAHILGVLPSLTEDSHESWIETILSFQSEDGWFRAGDSQGHGAEHSTAYALGALQILGAYKPALREIKSFAAEVKANPNVNEAPFRISLLDRTHFWRGSHRVGGLASIVGAVGQLGLDTQKILGVADGEDWLNGWWAYFEQRIDPKTGYWRLSNPFLHFGFDLLYRSRHDPTLARMGGAVHLYWVSERMGKPVKYPAQIVQTTAALQNSNGLYENEPYCIDLDGNFMIGRSLSGLNEDHPQAINGRSALARNREAILDWYAARALEQWNSSSHKLPGAFAAVAEAERVMLQPSLRRWRDVFETTWWL